MKKKRVMLCVILLAVAAIILSAVIVFSLTPVPISLLIRKAFESPSLTRPDGYNEMESAVIVQKNIAYPSEYGNNEFDIYLPNDAALQENSIPSDNGALRLPLIIWVHGGAYVGGDKSDARYFCTALASDGYVVVSMNYARAPEAQYPTPLFQMQELYAHLLANDVGYPIDFTRIFFAGDSAGAHSVAQFALIQTNLEYANQLALTAIVPADHIRGLLLYCGPYDIKMTGNMESTLFGFFIDQAAWAYFGERNWMDAYDRMLTIENHITPNFPPTFITDGNSSSFEQQGKNLAAALKKLSVPTTTYFIPIETEKTMHEFQFQMNSTSGKECYNLTLQFLAEQKK